MRIARLEPTALLDAATRDPVAIAAAVRSSGWRIVPTLLQLTRSLVAETRASDGGAGSAVRGRRVRALLERLGGLWIKVGQLLSLRIDLFSVDFCQELAGLQDRVPGFPGEDARRLIEQELGRPLHEIFADFDPHPVAAASIGQVHRARLHDGAVVAVKVRRPFVEELLVRELRLIRIAISLLTWLRLARFMRWKQFQWEIESILQEELDYRREASSMTRLRRNLTPRGMYVPRVYAGLSTARVLVMEYVSGVLMSDYITTLHRDPRRVAAWRRTNNVDPKRLALRFSLSILRQIIEDNLYHGDLHPGNVVLLRNSRVALLDFGTAGTTDRQLLELFSRLMQALGEQQYERAVDFALLMTGRIPRVDLARVRAEVVRELSTWGRRTDVPSLPYSVKSVDAVNVALSRAFFRHRITFQWAFLRIRRALSTMDATAMHVDPDADYTRIVQLYFRRARRRALRAHARSGVTRTAATLLTPRIDVERQIGDVAQLALQIERRRLRTASPTLSTATHLLYLAAGCARVAAIGIVLAAVVGLAAQHGELWLRQVAEWMSAGFVGRAPEWSWQTWTAIIAAGAVASQWVGKLAARR